MEEKEREEKLITWGSSCNSDLSAEGEGKEAFDAIDLGEAADENLNPNPRWGFGSGSNSYSGKPKSEDNEAKTEVGYRPETLKSAKSGIFNMEAASSKFQQ